MNQTRRTGSIKNLLYILGGLGGVSLIIIIHEMGHFLFAKFFGVATPIFSLGFGPALFSFPIGQTVFTVALLPFGGYVEMDPAGFAELSYFPKILILSAGILFNLIFAYIILLYYAIRNKCTMKNTITNTITAPQTAEQTESSPENMAIGPVGIISMIGKSLAINPQLYWFILAILSLNMGLFNILPLPFFDGGKAFIITLETIMGKTIPQTALWLVSTAFLALFILFITRVTIHDIRRLIGKK
jgi:membrane-associated protease RseP (regulator of RpoE activity)